MRKHYPLDPSTGVENAALLPWTNGVPSTGTEGSYPPAALCTDTEAEVLNAQAAAGLPASPNDDTQLAQAMSIGLFLGTFGGTPNALTATLQGSVSIPSLQFGMRFHGIVGPSANTGTTTLAISGFATNAGVKPARKGDGATELGADDLKAGALATWVWDGAAYRLVGLLQSDVLALISAQSSSPTSTIQAAPRNIVPFLASTTWTCPANVTRVYVRVWAAAGGAGGAGYGSGGSPAAAPGGGAGEYREGTVAVTPGTTYAITVGIGGPGGTSAPGNGGNGGASSFDVLITAVGGAGSTGVLNTVGGSLAAGGSGGSGGQVALSGNGGGQAILYTTGSLGGGIGGAPAFGRGINSPNINGPGAAGNFPGGGGTGGSSVTAGTGNAGGAGGNGFIILYY